MRSPHQKLWISDAALPQHFIFRRSGERKPEVNCIGFHCWYDYLSNPKSLRLYCAKPNANFVEWDTFLLPRVTGETRFKIRAVPSDYTLFKIVIHTNYGDEVTYLNSVTFYHDTAQSGPSSATNG